VDTLRYSVWLQDQLGQEAQSNWQNIYIHRQSQSLNAVEIERIPIILFGFNQHQLTPSSRQFYKKVIQIADKLKSDPQAACVLKGFADAIGDRLYNLHLSIQRAQTIYNGLAKLGVEKSRMQYLGFGKEYPLGENRLPEGRVMNRRVEVYIGYGGYAP
jgi:outer membrane protein OmpA-like peptidoglycan-associated protein